MTQVCFTDVGFPPNIVISNTIDQKRTGIFTLDEVVFGTVSSQVIPEVARMFPTWQFLVTNVHMEGPDVKRKVYPTWIVVKEKNVERGRIQIKHPWRVYGEELVMENPRIHRAMERKGRKTTTKPKVAVQIIKQYFTDPPITEAIEVVAKRVRSQAEMQKVTFGASRDLEYMRLIGLVQSYVEENLPEIAKHVSAVNTNFDVPEYLNTVADTKISASVMDTPPNSTLTVMLHNDKYVLHRSKMPVYVFTSEGLPEPVRMAIGLLKLVGDGQFVKDIGYRYKEDQFLVVYDGPLNTELTCKTSN